MPDLDKPPWRDIATFVRTDVLPLLLIVVVAIIALRLARIFVHGIVKALLDREATEGTAQELSAVEVAEADGHPRRPAAATPCSFFIVVIAGLMILGQLGLDIGPAVAGLGVVGIAVGFGAQTWSATTSTAPSSSSRTSSPRATSCASAGWPARSRTSRLRRTTLRDLDGVVHTVPNGEVKVASNLTRVWSRINQDVTVAYGTDIDKAIEVVDAVGREMAADADLAAADPRGAARRARRGARRVGVTLKILGTVRAPDQWAAERRAAASACSRRSGPTASRSRAPSASSSPSQPDPLGGPPAHPARPVRRRAVPRRVGADAPGAGRRADPPAGRLARMGRPSQQEAT